MKIIVFLVVIASILEHNKTFQNTIPLSGVSIYEEQCAVNYGKIFLAFLKYVKIFDNIHARYDPARVDQVARIATECYTITANIPELNTFNVILESMDIQEEMQRIVKKVQSLHAYKIYDRVIPQFIQMADKFLSQAICLRNPAIQLPAQTAEWRAILAKMSSIPLSPAITSCLQMIQLVEMNPAIYTAYLKAVQAVPDDIREEILLNLGKQVNLGLQLNRKEPIVQSVLNNIGDMKIVHPGDHAVVETIESFKSTLLPPPFTLERSLLPPPLPFASEENTAVAAPGQQWCPIDSSKTYLMFNRYLPVIRKMETKLDNFNSVAQTADQCYKITKNIPGLTTLNLVLLSMESELVVRSLAEQNPHMSLPSLYEHVTPRLIKMMDRFLLAAMAVQQAEIHIETWAEGWKNHLKGLLVQPLSDEGKACLRIIKLIETNPELYHSYFDALQVVPGDIIEEIVLTLKKMANTLPTITHRQSLLPSRLSQIESHEPKYPDPVLLEEEIAQFASQLRDANGLPPPSDFPLPPPLIAPIETPGQAENDGILPRFLMRQLLEMDKAY